MEVLCCNDFFPLLIGFYTTVAVWCFIVLPWVYFYFEEGGGDEGVKQVR